MSDLAKVVIGLVLWLTLTSGSYFYTKSCICASLPFCKHKHIIEQTITTNQPLKQNRAPIDFEKSKFAPLTNQGYEELKNTILSEKTADNLLEITGYYYDEERNTSTYPNLGLARANKLKALFDKDILVDRIRLKAIKAPIPFNKDKYVTASAFKWLPAPKLSTVEIFTDRTVVRFPFNSVQKELDSDIDQYLDKLAKRIKETKEKVSLTGHTDNIGEEEVNVKLALRRAKMIRDILIDKGVNRRQINTYSKGKSEPIDDNATEEGRRKNRRVVVRLIAADK